MVSLIPYSEQFFVEKKRNERFQWYTTIVTFGLLVAHGLLFYWGPRLLRAHRSPESIRFKPYFKFVQWWTLWTGSVLLPLKFWRHGIERRVYFQPLLALLAALYVALCGVFTYRETADIDYLPRYYVCGKRVARVAIGKLIPILFFVFKLDLVTSVSGFSHDRLVILHKWLARLMWIEITIHFIISIEYWLGLHFRIMIEIPPQIFGMMAYGFFCIMTWGSLKFIRKLLFEVFLVQHRVANFLYLLFAFFHNGGNKAAVLIAVHTLVADRIVQRVIGIIHSNWSPSKGMAYCEVLDEGTLRVSIPVATEAFDNTKSCVRFLPKVNFWNAGMYCFLTVPSLGPTQLHPFSILTLPESREMVLVIRKRGGFTKKLHEKVVRMQHNLDLDIEEVPVRKWFTPIVKKVKHGFKIAKRTLRGPGSGYERPSDIYFEEKYNGLVKIPASFLGPVGGKMQPLITFDLVLFIAGGTGASFTFPLCLRLCEELEARDTVEDFAYRPRFARIRCVWAIRSRTALRWYDHLIGSLMPHIELGRLQFDVYVTRDDSEIEYTPIEKARKTEKEKVATETTQPVVVTLLLSSGESLMATTLDASSRSSFAVSRTIPLDLSKIPLYKSRPPIHSIVEEEANGVLGNSNIYRGLGIVVSGPTRLAAETKVQAQVQRRKFSGPDIYCYSEAYD